MNNVETAINLANAKSTELGLPYGVAYYQGDGWHPYDFRNGTTGEPEFICLGLGKMPLPVTPIAAEVIASLVRSLV